MISGEGPSVGQRQLWPSALIGRAPIALRNRVDWALAIALFVFSALLIAPLFRIEYFDNWGTIDNTFIADSRFLARYWPQTGWQPWWYCGSVWDYLYPPALRYAVAALSLVADISTARAYHIYTAFMYCVGTAGMYVVARALEISKTWALTAGIVAVTCSPTFLLLPLHRNDSLLHMPQRLNVLVKWGEGPHTSAIALLPFAVALSWLAVRNGGPRRIVGAALICALVVAHNFYGATALAMLYGVLAWSVFITNRDVPTLWRALIIPVLTSGLSAFWLTPGYLRLTIDNLHLVAQPGNRWSKLTVAALLAIYGACSFVLARKERAAAPSIFLTGAALLFGAVVIGHSWFQLRVVGEPHRLVPEVDLVMILVGAYVVQLLGRRVLGPGMRETVVAACVLAAIGLIQFPYVSGAWRVFVADPNYQDRPEFQITRWLSRTAPDARVYATGSLRLWFNAWHDVRQVGGGSDQGVLNSALAVAQWQINKDLDAARPVAWLKATGADFIVVHEPASAVIYRDIDNPRKFEGYLSTVFDDGRGNIIYKVPRVHTAGARVVPESLVKMQIPSTDTNGAELSAYVAAVEDQTRPAVTVERRAPDVMELRARLKADEGLLVQESYHPAWRAVSAGKQYSPVPDPAGFLYFRLPSGDQHVRLTFEGPAGAQTGRWITLLSLVGSLLAVLGRPLRALSGDGIGSGVRGSR